MPQILKKLRKMKKHELIPMAEELGIEVADRWTSLVLAKKIREKQIQLAADAPEIPSAPEAEKPREKPDFEQLANEIPEEPEETEGRGGARDGAGRKPGKTDEMIAQERSLAIVQPDPNVKFALQIIYDIMTKDAQEQIPEVGLTETELTNWSLSVSKPYVYFVPESVRNSAWAACLEAALITVAMIRCKAMIIQQAKRDGRYVPKSKGQPVNE